MMLFAKDARGLSKSANELDSNLFIVLLLSKVDHLKYSLSCERFSEL